MDDSKRAKNMAKELRQIYRDTVSTDAFVGTVQGQFFLDEFTATLAWHLIDSS